MILRWNNEIFLNEHSQIFFFMAVSYLMFSTPDWLVWRLRASSWKDRALGGSCFQQLEFRVRGCKLSETHDSVRLLEQKQLIHMQLAFFFFLLRNMSSIFGPFLVCFLNFWLPHTCCPKLTNPTLSWMWTALLYWFTSISMIIAICFVPTIGIGYMVLHMLSFHI